MPLEPSEAAAVLIVVPPTKLPETILNSGEKFLRESLPAAKVDESSINLTVTPLLPLNCSSQPPGSIHSLVLARLNDIANISSAV